MSETPTPPTRKQLLTAWHKHCPTLTRVEAALSFDEWWECGSLDPKWDAERGEWKILLRGITPLTNPALSHASRKTHRRASYGLGLLVRPAAIRPTSQPDCKDRYRSHRRATARSSGRATLCFIASAISSSASSISSNTSAPSPRATTSLREISLPGYSWPRLQSCSTEDRP